MQPLFKPYACNCPVAENEYNQMITLPLHADLTDEEVNYVVDALIEFEELG